MNYLLQYHSTANLTLDFGKYEVRLHYVDFDGKNKEVEIVGDKLGYLRLAGSKLDYGYNELIDKKTFNVIWEITEE